MAKYGLPGRSPYGERGLKLRGWHQKNQLGGRSPYGERGLKCFDQVQRPSHAESLSLRRAWIEIGLARRLLPTWWRRSPYGERGLKYIC